MNTKAIKSNTLEVKKERENLFKLLLKKTNTTQKEFFELMRDMYITSNLEVLSAGEKRQFKKLSFK